MNSPLRLIAALGLIALIQVGSLWLRDWRASAAVVFPKWSESPLPSRLGDWVGNPVPPEDDVRRAVGAAKIYNSVYKGPRGQAISVHVALFDRETSGLPHHPCLCYPSNGYRLVREDHPTVEPAGAKKINAALAVFERQGQQFDVLYWYRVGTLVMTKSTETASARWQYAGRSQRPALVKVILQTADDPGTESETSLQSLAGALAAWMDQAGSEAPKAGRL